MIWLYIISYCFSGRLSGFLSLHCPERDLLWLTWLSPPPTPGCLAASPVACNQNVISALARAKRLGSKKVLPPDSLWGSSVKIGKKQRRLAWPLRKDDTHTSRSENMFDVTCKKVLPPEGERRASCPKPVCTAVYGVQAVSMMVLQ